MALRGRWLVALRRSWFRWHVVSVLLLGAGAVLLLARGHLIGLAVVVGCVFAGLVIAFASIPPARLPTGGRLADGTPIPLDWRRDRRLIGLRVVVVLVGAVLVVLTLAAVLLLIGTVGAAITDGPGDLYALVVAIPALAAVAGLWVAARRWLFGRLPYGRHARIRGR
jgi:hypothetical protein